jgi:hypothetical protein
MTEIFPVVARYSEMISKMKKQIIKEKIKIQNMVSFLRQLELEKEIIKKL